MAILIELVVGFVAGLLGGLLGVGGSVIIIPALIFYLSQTPQGYDGSQQHLIQAAAMICNVFVAAPGALAHFQARATMPCVLAGLLPGATVGMGAGVWLSNTSIFAKQRGAYLAIVLAIFLATEGLSHLRAFFRDENFSDRDTPCLRVSLWMSLVVGLVVGFIGGLLGIGGGTLSIPLQQRLLGVPLRNAIANSAVTIIVVSTFGAVYKNLSLWTHGFSPEEAVRLAALIVPTAMVGSYFGGKLTHNLSKRALELVLVVFFLSVAALTFDRAWAALRENRSATSNAAGSNRDWPSGNLPSAQICTKRTLIGFHPGGTADCENSLGRTRTVGASGPSCRRASKTATPTLTAKLRLRASGRSGIRTSRS